MQMDIFVEFAFV